MTIAIISKNNFLKDALEQVSLLKSFKIECFIKTLQSDYGLFDLVIFDSIEPELYDKNQIRIGSEFKTDLLKPFKLTSLIKLINDKLSHKIYKIKEMNFIPHKRVINFEETTVALTEKETDLILYLITHYPRKVPKSEILKNIWNYSEVTETSTIEVHLSRLKQKLNDSNLNDFIVSKDKNLSI